MTTFKPGDRFRIYGGRVAHVVERCGYHTSFAYCGVLGLSYHDHPADDRPLCKACARLMERNDR